MLTYLAKKGGKIQTTSKYSRQNETEAHYSLLHGVAWLGRAREEEIRLHICIADC